jgi:hypothetical protein
MRVRWATSITASCDGSSGSCSAIACCLRKSSGSCTKTVGQRRQQNPIGAPLTYSGAIFGFSFAWLTMQRSFAETSESAYLSRGKSGPSSRRSAGPRPRPARAGEHERQASALTQHHHAARHRREARARRQPQEIHAATEHVPVLPLDSKRTSCGPAANVPTRASHAAARARRRARASPRRTAAA